MKFPQEYIDKLNKDIERYTAKYPERNVFPITDDMNRTFDSVSQMVMLDRYTHTDLLHETLDVGDFVVLTVKPDPKWPTRGFGWVLELNKEERFAVIEVDEQFAGSLEGEEADTFLVKRNLELVQKPLEIYHEQIAMRNAWGLSSVEKTEEKRQEWFEKFYQELTQLNFVPAGRVMHGAGAGTDVTFFNCYVMPYVKDSREGISEHRGKVMEIMSRGGGVGTNGSTLRPRNEVARGVNGKSSGAVSWLNDIANLTNLVEQGGTRRGAQMIMLVDSHPDIVEFIISKMQNPKILKFIIENTNDEHIKEMAQAKLKFTPLSAEEKSTLEMSIAYTNYLKQIGEGRLSDTEAQAKKEAEQKLAEGGTWSVHNPEFLTGANISVCLTEDFMEAVENDTDYELRFPDVVSYTEEEMKDYNEKWHEVGDVREWEKQGYAVRTYRTIKAKELWQLINICATYSAEPGIFFIDNANDMTNAKAYGQHVVATNPCGEQPLSPWAVCNLAAVNLAEMASFETAQVDYEKLKNTVEVGVRMQDNVIDATPYFMEENTKQALGERRVGLGVMGLHDLLIKCQVEYGSEEGNEIVDKVFKTISETAYRTSIEIAKEKGSFPFLIGETEEETEALRYAFIDTGFMRKMPGISVRDQIIKHGIRNSHLLTVAPTGSTGTMVGGSTGLEPYFSFVYYRSGRLGKFIEVKAPIVQQYLEFMGLPLDTPLSELPSYFKGAMELAPEQHADVQCIIQKHVDSSLSKTVNAPKGYTVKQVEKVYERLWQGGAKGGTVYVDGSRDAQVLSLSAEENDVNELEIDSSQYEVDVDDNTQAAAEGVIYGVEPGNTCPVCKKGVVEEIGGCSTCTNCQAQLKCGL
ncbi:vitamin B12-dependent ribonucleotide reductase [Bacillus sp. ILBB4]|nr:vitamin B12-dependent ribonucleotide reductase [Bacillus sp. ILBB4]